LRSGQTEQFLWDRSKPHGETRPMEAGF